MIHSGGTSGSREGIVGLSGTWKWLPGANCPEVLQLVQFVVVRYGTVFFLLEKTVLKADLIICEGVQEEVVKSTF